MVCSPVWGKPAGANGSKRSLLAHWLHYIYLFSDPSINTRTGKECLEAAAGHKNRNDKNRLYYLQGLINTCTLDVTICKNKKDDQDRSVGRKLQL